MNFNTLDQRNDVGALWENFCIVERIKHNQEKRSFVNNYFWRTYDQKEIDYIEETGGMLHAFEFIWVTRNKVRRPEEFFRIYPESTYKVIDRETIWDFIKG